MEDCRHHIADHPQNDLAKIRKSFESNKGKADFLPISLFFYEIWVKNRPFSILKIEKGVCCSAYPFNYKIFYY